MSNEEMMNRLYSGRCKLEIEISGNENNLWSVCLKGLDGEPDCQVGHFGENFFVRTSKGVKRKRYKTVKLMIREVTKCLEREGYIATDVVLTELY